MCGTMIDTLTWYTETTKKSLSNSNFSKTIYNTGSIMLPGYTVRPKGYVAGKIASRSIDKRHYRLLYSRDNRSRGLRLRLGLNTRVVWHRKLYTVHLDMETAIFAPIQEHQLQHQVEEIRYTYCTVYVQRFSYSQSPTVSKESQYDSKCTYP